MAVAFIPLFVRLLNVRFLQFISEESVMPNESSLSWDSLPERRAWSAQLRASITEYKIQLDQGNPEAFVSGYAALPAERQIKFWAELIIAVAKFESNWKPHTIFHEPPPLGVDSVGLLQLSYEDQPVYHLEPLDRQAKSLEDPLVNLRCGVKIMAKLVSKDGTVASSAAGKHRGAARYWSVLRAGHHVDEIRALVKAQVGI
jgi:hypothetical protein